MDEAFWQALEALAASSSVVIDRPARTAHPRHPDMIYPLDYGYLAGTSAMDGGGIDLWRGTDPAGRLDAVICMVDVVKRDAEIKLLIGCTEAEKQTVLAFHNATDGMKGLLIRRHAG